MVKSFVNKFDSWVFETTQFGEESQAHRLTSLAMVLIQVFLNTGSAAETCWEWAGSPQRIDGIDSLLTVPWATENLQTMCFKEKPDFSGEVIYSRLCKTLESGASQVNAVERKGKVGGERKQN